MTRGGFVEMLARAHGAISDGGPPPVSLAEARHVIETLTGLYSAAETGCAVDLPIASSSPLYDGWVR